jgi:hypothetical protein
MKVPLDFVLGSLKFHEASRGFSKYKYHLDKYLEHLSR